VTTSPVSPSRVGIFVFDEVEVLDFAGPFEVFGVTGWRTPPQPFEVFLVAADDRRVVARNGLEIIARHTFADCPPIDILVVPGGWGSRTQLARDDVVGWVRSTAGSARLALSVCSGALILAKAGLLGGGPATTHHGAYDELRTLDPSVEVVEGVKMVDRGTVVTSGGISAGIDMSLGVVARLLGPDVAQETADYMEYDWTPSVGRAPAGP
jgi:transcriptional regulator GlxA family with amidase domain